MGSFLTGFAVASALLGCALGAWGAGQLADRHGGSGSWCWQRRFS